MVFCHSDVILMCSQWQRHLPPQCGDTAAVVGVHLLLQGRLSGPFLPSSFASLNLVLAFLPVLPVLFHVDQKPVQVISVLMPLFCLVSPLISVVVIM